MTLRVRTLPTAALSADEIARIRSLLRRAFQTDDFTDDDWAHSVGGVHAIAHLDGRLVGYGSVVERLLVADGHPLRTGYVEGVGTDPVYQGRGIGSQVLVVLGAHIT